MVVLKATLGTACWYIRPTICWRMEVTLLAGLEWGRMREGRRHIRRLVAHERHVPDPIHFLASWHAPFHSPTCTSKTEIAHLGRPICKWEPYREVTLILSLRENFTSGLARSERIELDWYFHENIFHNGN